MRDQTNIFRNIGVGGAAPLAVNHFMKVIRILNVRGFHTYILSISTAIDFAVLDRLLGDKRI